MPLPAVPLDTGTVEVGGADVAIRSLSRTEVVSLAKFGDDTSSAEIFMLARATGVTEDEAREWLDKVSAETAGDLLGAIGRISGLAVGGQ
jgi:hypothetical protein